MKKYEVDAIQLFQGMNSIKRTAKMIPRDELIERIAQMISRDELASDFKRKNEEKKAWSARQSFSSALIFFISRLSFLVCHFFYS